MERIIINARREAYGIEDIYDTLTAGELIRILKDFDEDTPIYLSHDNGYTYGGIRDRDIDETFDEENEDAE